jgi:hypothetical protein
MLSFNVLDSCLPSCARLCGVLASLALHTLSTGQSTIRQPHPISVDLPARSAQLLNGSTPASSLKQMRLNLRIGHVYQSRPANTPTAHVKTTMTRR